MTGPVFRVVQVRRLPYFHNPFRCDYFDRWDTDDDGDPEAGRRFYDALAPSERASCSYHRCADWRRVAAASVEVFRASRGRSASELDRQLERVAATLPAEDAEQLYYLFADPIDWRDGSATVVNGQHRTCAIRASGAGLCVVCH